MGSPGPGQYELDKTNTSFKTKHVKVRHQFFGSSDDRMKKWKEERPKEDPGPGHYTTDKRPKTTKAKVPFTSIVRRFTVDANPDSPGPDSYQA